MPDPSDAPGPQGGARPDPPHDDPGALPADDAATWGGEGGAGSYRGSPQTQPPLRKPEKKEG